MPSYETSAASAGKSDFAAYSATAWSSLVRTAHLLTGDFDDAEDLVRTTLAQVHARRRRFPRDDVDFYVRRSLVENNLSRIRKRRLTHLLMPFQRGRVHRPDAGPAEALTALSAQQRTVLVLRYWEDLTEAGIAELLGCSPGTVRTRLRDGLAALRAHSAFSGFSEFSAFPAFDVRDRPHTLSGVRR